ncbi:MAG: tetratricopeptide repeat protein [Candidatus Hodarchaeales archaeon]|jgi:tetratricopeptide (TPR) repeat protein
MSSQRRKRIQELYEVGSEDLERALRLPSDDPRRVHLLDSAQKSFEETVRIKPGFILGYRKIALIHEEKGNNEATIKTLDKILELQPHDETAILKISQIRKAKGEIEKADQIELQTHYQEVQELLKKYEDGVVAPKSSMSIAWEGVGKPKLESDEPLKLLFKEVDMTINRVDVSNGTLIVTDRRIILEGMRIYGTQTGSFVAREYEQRRGKLGKRGTAWPEAFIGLSLPFKEIDDIKLVWLGRVPTLHIAFQSSGHAGISGIPSAMAEKVVKELDLQGVSVSQEKLKLCASWIMIMLPLTSLFSLLLTLV